jgi:multidrug transporter EmrE-like cation transporter
MNTEEELQHRLEQGVPLEDSLNARAYSLVFEVLKQEPQFQLPAHFADQVVNKINVKKSNSYDHFWLGLGILSFFLGSFVCLSLTGIELNMRPFKFLSGYAGFILFGVALITAIQLLDRKIAHKGLNF